MRQHAGREPGAAAVLAARALRLCLTGLELRRRGGCAAGDGAERRHARRGHDAGCTALGLHLGSVERAVSRWDRCGAAALVLEGVRAGVRSISEDPTARVDAEAAAELLAYELGRRITPAPAAALLPGGLAPRSVSGRGGTHR